MFYLPHDSRRVLALALAAAFFAPAWAEDTQPYAPLSGISDLEQASTSAIGPIRAKYAYTRGITGQGVTIAILDTGITASHREFSGPGKLAPGYNAVTGGMDIIDRAGHGTHVAGILGAERDGSGIFGVAYDARLLPIKVFSDSGDSNTHWLDRGLRYAIGKASIVSMSLGTPTSYDARALQDVIRSGLLVVAAAGNTGAPNPEWPARFARQAWANNQIIAVGAVDAAGRIASFSNRAGDTAAWFLVAPGVNIASAYLNNQYVYMSGTSMATPVVSGAAALIKQAWPYLRADQIANILFITATDLGAPGIDPVYGRGMVNVEKALQPVGTVKTTTWNGAAIKVLDTSIQPSAATSKLWNLASSGTLRVMGLDDFGRGFPYDLGLAVSRPAQMSLAQIFGDADRRIDIAERVLADGSRLLAAYENALPSGTQPLFAAPALRGPILTAFSFVSHLQEGTEFALGAGGMTARYFGIGSLRPDGDLSALPALANPYFALVPQAAHVALAQQIGGQFRFKFGLLSSGLNQAIASQCIPSTAPEGSAITANADAALIELSTSSRDSGLALSVSRTNETDAYLGARLSGAFAFRPTVTTSAFQLAGAWLVLPKLALAGSVAYGITPGGAGNSSLIADMTTARTNAFSIALIASDRIASGDRFSIALSQPMRTYAGGITLDVVTGIDGNGAQVRGRQSYSMVPAAREMMTEINYHAPAGKNATAGVALSLRRNPNHFVDVAPEKLLAMRYMKLF